VAAHPRCGSQVRRRDICARLAPAHEGWRDRSSQSSTHTGSIGSHDGAKDLSQVEALIRFFSIDKSI
jgi:hypothetical protein